MRTIIEIMKQSSLKRIIFFLSFLLCSSFVSSSFAADPQEGSSVAEPDYYENPRVVHSKNRKGETVESVSVKNAYKYVKQDTDYLVKLSLDGSVSSDDIAYLLSRYQTTLGSFNGTEATQEDLVIDKLEDMLDDGEITEEQYKNARRKNALAFDELYKQSMRQTIAVGKGNVESFDPSKFTKDPAYHQAYNRANRDKKDGIFSEDETKTRQDDYITDGLAKKDVVETLTRGCDVKGMREQYQSKCYSCVIIKTLIETFLNACSKAYDITSEAGLKLLAFGALVWMAFFVMKNVSSLSNVEPGAMMNTLMTFLFKVMVASILITSGLGVLVKYTINPLLTAGADMGMAFMTVTSDISGAKGLDAQYKVKTPSISDNGTSTEIVSSDVMNKIMLFAQDLDKNVSVNLVVGHAITCWSLNGGAWSFEIGPIKLSIVNLWLWFCGACIWFVGFMLTLGIGYYLLDISFKLGFSIIALPVVIGLWPFNVTKGKVMAVISIMIKAAGTFVFLALTTTYALALTSMALRDTPTLLKSIDEGKAEYISQLFELTGPYFLIIVFAFLYSMKLISSTVTDYVDKFCSDAVFGKADPMHGKLTQMTDMTKQLGLMPVKWAGKKVGNAAKEQAKKGAIKTGRFVKGLFKGKANGDIQPSSQSGGNVATAAGRGAQAAGATTEQAGRGVQAAGRGVEAGGRAAQAGGRGMMNAGRALSSTGLGAIVGVPMMIAGGATYAAGKGAEVAGKATQQIGKAMKKGGKAMKKTGEKMEKAGEKMQKVGDRLKFGSTQASEPKPETSAEGQNDKPKEDKPENPKKDEENKK